MSIYFGIIMYVITSLAAGEDYDAINESVVFNSDSVLVQPLCVEINITDDDVVESTEQLSVTLTSLSPDQLSDDTPQATVTIEDDNNSKWNLLVVSYLRTLFKTVFW